MEVARTKGPKRESSPRGKKAYLHVITIIAPELKLLERLQLVTLPNSLRATMTHPVHVVTQTDPR